MARTELHPWAMLAKGRRASGRGVFSRVWTRLGFKASLSRGCHGAVGLQIAAVDRLAGEVVGR